MRRAAIIPVGVTLKQAEEALRRKGAWHFERKWLVRRSEERRIAGLQRMWL
jgi:hypothetical protein